MNRRLIALLSVVLLSVSFLLALAGTRDGQWKQVDEAMSQGLPKTAIEKLEPIIRAAIEEKAYAEAIKAIGRKIVLEGNIQGNKPEEKITRLQAEIAKVPAEMKPVMQAILANWYWHYFQQNKWRFMQRTATAAPPGDDFTTWDLPRLFAEIDKQFTAALAEKQSLQQTPIAQYNDLLQPGTVPDAYRPTLYDFLVHNALEFYTSGEQAAAKPSDAFELPADGPIFGTPDEFVGWKVVTTDEDSPVYKAVLLYQDLLRFHQKDTDPTALADADLLRLQFAHNAAFGEEKNARYQAALKRYVDKWGDHEISTRAIAAWASVLQEEGQLVEAHELAARGARVFPESPGGKMCFNLLHQIEAKSVSITTERVWNEPWPAIQVRYRNVTKAHFRVVRWRFEERINSRNWQVDYLDEAEQRNLLNRPPTLQWSADLPATEDYQERLQEIPGPQDLKPGFYYLVASHDPSFGETNNQVSYAPFWVSRLALVIRNRWGENALEGFVLDAASGEPVAGVDVRAWQMGNRNERIALPPVKTDKNGLFRLATVENRNHLILVQHQDQQLATAENYSTYRGDQREQPYQRTFFFTDRSLYRPGQTIQYKGISVRVETEADKYEILANHAVTSVFQDVNGQEIARQQHRTNDFGSFSGSFTAPRDRLMGRMTVRVEGDAPGETSFNVEEYKRPKFQVTLDAPKTAAKLNAAVSLQGKATAYTGAAIDGANVHWRVVREVRYPVWWYWRMWWLPPQPESSQEIARGTSVTAADGGFAIEFTAKPDLSVPEKDEPTFQYTVYADVTDTAGETRSDERSVNVGYTALQATLSAGDWLTEGKPVDVKIRTTTLDGEGQQAEGSLKIHRLKQPERVQRAPLSRDYYPYLRGGKPVEPAPDLSNPNSWPLGEVVAERGFTTDAAGTASYSFDLPEGAYRTLVETQDRFGKRVTAELPLQVLNPAANKLAIKVPQVFAAPKWSLQPGEDFTALWGTGYEQGRAFVEIEHRHKLVQSYWTDAAATQATIKQAVSEAMRGGFTVRVTMVRENRAYLDSRRVDVPWTNKDLKLRWEHFVSKLQPGQKETWTLIVGPSLREGKIDSRSESSTVKAVAEMVAALYDQSLDAYLPHGWMSGFGVFRQDSSNLNSHFENFLLNLQHIRGHWPVPSKDVQLTYRTFPADLTANLWGYRFLRKGVARMRRGEAVEVEAFAMDAAPAPMAAAAPMEANAMMLAETGAPAPKPQGGELKDGGAGGPGGPEKRSGPDLSQVSARTNLNETAFFFPHLIAGAGGEVRLEFTMPEALTQWKFLGFAHDRQLRSGLLQDSAVTAKDLMVQPNPPRFLREGDVLEFTVKVSNQSPARQTGSVRLTLADARTGKGVDGLLGNNQTDQEFDIPAQESRSFSWRLSVPDELGYLTYKTVGSTGKLSDGEEGYLPVLSRRVLVTESLPLPIRGPQTKKFAFAKLLSSGDSDTLRHQSLTVQMVPNPSWYAVMALPYLMEFPYECTEQTFNRLYANALARHIANSDPKIRRVFEQWKGTPALDSPLEKNQDLKAVMLEETPWVRDAKAEGQARRNVGVLFDDNRLNDETARLLRKLAEQQREDGAWPWFPGGPANDYMTLYITTGFGRLRHLGVDLDVATAIKSLTRLDAWIDETYREILKHGDKEKNHLATTIALYLYGRSFFLEDQPVDAAHREAVDYFLGQARRYWLDLANRQSQAHLAVALKRFGDRDTPQAIMRSIKERSVSDEELGMFWRELELSWWWYRAPIETQAMMIEAFDEVMNDAQAVEACKVWLLKQKQTQDWKTTKATADAVYGLLLRGTDLLASDALVEVSLAGTPVKPQTVEAGTGFYEQRFAGPEVKPAQGAITVRKTDPGVAWGSVHWQYLEDMTKVTPYEGTPLKLKKSLYVKENTDKGPVLQPVAGPIKVGDELVVRVELRTDRDMEYVHLKDHRGSGTEPVSVLSQYKFQDGLYYYESTRDAASHFFIDYLPKGVYVFENSVRVQHRGQYQTGMAQIQCMYAPEFNSHSESIELKVQ
ncbi:MAG TPA: alpha-2-macroglobulin family protein [Candidatus Anammoximicrobium sp.]|nr:alpha-2-macroglobulin family protein [Candidatus Anammoximicrobium sp.]